MLQSDGSGQQDPNQNAEGTRADQAVRSDGHFVAVRDELQVAKGHSGSLEATLNVESISPNAIEVEKEMDALEGQLERLVELRRRDGTHRDPGPSRSDLLKQVEALQGLVADVETEKAVIEESIGRYIQSLRQPYASSVDLQFAESDLASWGSTRNAIHDRLKQFRVEREALDAITELERASPPVEPESSHLYRKIATVAASGFCIPFVLLPAIYGFIYLRRSADGVSSSPQL
ncbi:MAG: hypothetical protein ACK5OB_10385 [Pirellula sp.]